MTDAAGSAADAVKGAADAAQDAAATAAGKAEDAASAVAEKTDKAAATVSEKTDKAAEAVAGEPAPAPVRSMDEIEADLAATRERLAGRLDELQEYVSPKNLIGRQVEKFKGVFVDEYGGIKPDKVLIAAGAVVGVVVLFGVLGRRRRG